MHMKLLDFENLAKGSAQQRQAYEALQKIELFQGLSSYSPLLVGAIPLGVDIESSSLEVVCSADNLEGFAAKATELLSSQESFYCEHKILRARPAVLVSFRSGGFTTRILAQDVSSFTQNAVVQMLVEARLLAFAPSEVRDEIRVLKRQGLSTEQAFVRCFDLDMVLNKKDPFEKRAGELPKSIPDVALAAVKDVAGELILKAALMPDHELLTLAHRYRFRPQ
jgi:hypothetical protein